MSEELGSSLLRALFGEEGIILRLVLVVGGLMGSVAYVEVFWQSPWVGVENGLRDPERHVGSLVAHGPARVVEADTEGFVVQTLRGTRVRVEAEHPLVRIGDEVVYKGIIQPTGHLALLRREGRTLLRMAPNGIAKRLEMYAVSLAMLGYVAFRFHGTFRLRSGRFETRAERG